ncbi:MULTISPECIES: AzlC family ABC transporter permease [Micrococcaceae]|uniref:AzlC family ABC transporter permease n=1 Tax=unclassified Kocuria TaxID=2649579 RepID=UPI0010113E71|nr:MULTISPECIES: AzlC family ABC transporter permease [unclassified Kocuria]
MRSIYRTVSRLFSDTVAPTQRRNAMAIFLTLGAVGLSYGALSQSSGFAIWQTVLLAALATSGAAELTFVGVIAAGGAPIFAVLGGLLVNSRNFAFGLSAGEYVPRGWRRLLASHMVNDETVAFARSVRGRQARWQHFVVMAILLFPAWVGGAALGQLLGSVVDADALGLDAAFPIILFCLVVQDLKNPLVAIIAGGGAILAISATPVLPLGLGAVASLVILIPAAGFIWAKGHIRPSRTSAEGGEV